MIKLLRSVFVGALCLFALPVFSFGAEINMVTGRIVDATTREPLPGSTVYVLQNGQKVQKSDWVQQIFTDDGKFNLWHVPQDAQIEVQHMEYKTKTFGPIKSDMGDLQMERKNARVLQDAVVEAARPRPGFVIDSVTNQPLSGVRATTTDKKGESLVSTTGADGKFVFDAVLPDNAKVLFEANGYNPRNITYSENMQVTLYKKETAQRMPGLDMDNLLSGINAPDPNANIDLPTINAPVPTLPDVLTITVAGVVINQEREPLYPVNILVLDHNNNSNVLSRTQTGYDGDFRIAKVPENAKLKVSIVGYKEKIVDNLSSNMSIVLDPVEMKPVTIVNYYGKVFDFTTKQAINGVSVTATDANGNALGSAVKTDGSGSFVMTPKEFPDGAVKVRFDAQGYHPRLLTYTKDMQVTLISISDAERMPGLDVDSLLNNYDNELQLSPLPSVQLPTLQGSLSASRTIIGVDTPPAVFANIDYALNKYFQGSSVWKNDEGKFNTARLASDSIAGVVLGTVGGVVTSTVMKKNQVKKGFENLKCTIGGQDVAEYADVFEVKLQR